MLGALLSDSGLGGAVAIPPGLRRVGFLDAEWKICPICIFLELGLAAKRMVVVMMVCAGKPGWRMFAHGMFAGNRVVGMRGVGTRGAVIRQSGAVALHRSASRAGCRGVTAQAATRAAATSASTHMSAAATAAARVSSAATAATAATTATARVSATTAAAATARVSAAA
jgi:hypothetical protein